jgi:hypothetical protein
VLVISTRGIGDAEHRMMKTGGIYERIVLMQDERRNRFFHLIIAVARVDAIADERFMLDRRKRKREHFTEVCNETEKNIPEQLKVLLKEELLSLGINNVPPIIVNWISKGIDIVPISAVEFRKFCIGDPDDRPFITNKRQSGIPRLQKLLSVL